MKIIAPRVQTPVPGSGGKTTISGVLPDAMVSEQVERLAVFSAVIGGLWLFGLSMDSFVVPVLLDQARRPSTMVLEGVGIAVAAATYWYLGRSRASAANKAAVGPGFLIANALGVALLNAFTMSGRMPEAPNVSWNAVLILTFSMIAPTRPIPMFAASLVAACMDPLVNLIAYLRGVPALPPVTSLLHYSGNFICAAVAMVPSHVFQRLRHQLRQAQELGSYRLLELLGRGGMGEVWRAEHRLLARTAAVKLVRPEVLGASSDNDARLILRRFEREAKATAALQSPHTIQVFDFGMTNEGTFYYVMELLSGRDLETLIREFGPLPAERAIYLLRQVCHSLADAHARGLVHRDIKPANIYVCRMGLEYDFAKVLDFGLVKFRDRASLKQTLMTVDHRTTGTPAYMAPEIILGEADVDRRADVYALGCVAYFILTGQLVFEADTPMKMLMQHVQAAPVPPSQRTELPIPRELDELVLACLEKDPAKRPQHAQELLGMALHCQTCEGWTQRSAADWWEKHLPDLAGPLTDATAEPEPDSALVV